MRHLSFNCNSLLPLPDVYKHTIEAQIPNIYCRMSEQNGSKTVTGSEQWLLRHSKVSALVLIECQI